MKSKFSLLLVFCMTLFPMNINAQIGSFLRNKAEQFLDGTSNSEEESSEQDNTSVADQTEAPAEPSSGSSLSGIISSRLEQMGTVSLSYEENYDFKGQIVMETKYYDGSSDNEPGIINMVLWLGDSNDNFSIENEFISGEVEEENLNVIAIADNNNQCYIMLLGGEVDVDGGMAVITPIPPEDETPPTTSTEDIGNPNIKKTGKTETIAGYRCDEYTYTDDTSSASYWVTNDSRFGFDNEQLKKAGMSTYYSNSKIDGFVMKYAGYADDDLVMTMEVTNIDNNARKSFSTANYFVMQADQQ